jgi:hypothetical protein
MSELDIKRVESWLRGSDLCGECGGVNDAASERWCACWTPLSDLNLADVKGLFARVSLGIGVTAAREAS